MSDRIRQLENALALLQSSISSAKHPLLQDELLLIKHGPAKHLPGDPDIPGDSFVEAVDAFGTLTIGDRGESRYFGPSAGSEVRISAASSLDKGAPNSLTMLRPCFR